MILRIVRSRFRYYWRHLVKFTGFCPDCWGAINYTTTGRPLCPDCT